MASSPNHIAVSDSFVDTALSRQLYVFQPSTYKSQYIEINATRWKKIMDTIVELMEGRLLTNAGTYALNEIGKQMNMTRYSDDNEVYRTSILMREAASTKSTTRTNIVNLIADVFDLETSDVYVTKWGDGRIDIILLDICITSTSAIEEIKRLLPILTRYTIGTKSAGTLLSCGSLQEFEDYRDSGSEIYTLNNSGTLGSMQEYEENSEGNYDDDNLWGYCYQIESEVI